MLGACDHDAYEPQYWVYCFLVTPERSDAGRRQSGPVLRELRKSDAKEVAELFRVAFGDARPMDAQEVVRWFDNSELNSEWLRVLEHEGRIVGYGDILIQNNEVVLDLAAPEHEDAFFGWAKNEARLARASQVRVFAPAGHELEQQLERNEYRLWRSSYTMEVELSHLAPEACRMPPGIELRYYESGDAEPLRAAINEVFVDDPFFVEASTSHFREFYLRARGFDSSLWLLACDREELAGFALAFAERVGEPGLGWIHSLGVKKPWRRRGLGEALLRAAFRDLHARGLRRIGLGVDAENEAGALRLYERVGMRVVRQSNKWVLRL